MAKELYTSSFFNDPNLIAYWRMENTNDSKGSFNLTNNGSVTFTSGKFYNAANFNDGGTNSSKYLSRASNDVRTGTGNFTHNLWFKTSKTGVDQRLLTYGAAATNQAVYLYIKDTDNKLVSTLHGRSGERSANAVTDGSWHMATQVYDGTYLKLYLDGDLEAQGGASPDIGNTGFTIGRDWSVTSLFFTGLIDDVSIFTRDLSSAEIKKLFRIGNAIMFGTNF